MGCVFFRGFPQAESNAYLHLSKGNGSKSLFTRLPILSSIPRASRPEHSSPEGGAEGWAGAGSFEMQRPSRARPRLVPRLARAVGCLAFLRASRARRRLDWLRGPNLSFLGCFSVGSRSGLCCCRPCSSPAGPGCSGIPQGWGHPGLLCPSKRDESGAAEGTSPGVRDVSGIWECLPAWVGMGSCHRLLCCLHMGLFSSSSPLFPPPLCWIWEIIYFKVGGFFPICHIWQPFPLVTSCLAGTQQGWVVGCQQDPRAGGVGGTPRAGPGDKSSPCELGKGTAWQSHPWGTLKL